MISNFANPYKLQISNMFFFFFSNHSDIGFEVPNEFLVGYALDYNEFFRDLGVSEKMS